MDRQDEKLKEIFNEMRNLILDKVPSVKNRLKIMENDFDPGKMTRLNNELDSYREKYKYLCRGALEINRTRAKKEIKEIIKTKKELDENFIRDMKNALQGDNPAFWAGP